MIVKIHDCYEGKLPNNHGMSGIDFLQESCFFDDLSVEPASDA